MSFSRSEARLAFYLTRDRAPANLWVYDLEAGGEARQLTRSLNPEMDEAHLVGSEVVRYPSFDGLEIPAILWRPHGASAETPVPAVVLVHGGPGGQARRTVPGLNPPGALTYPCLLFPSIGVSENRRRYE